MLKDDSMYVCRDRYLFFSGNREREKKIFFVLGRIHREYKGRAKNTRSLHPDPVLLGVV